MLIAGADVSGSSDTDGQISHIAIVVGTIENINKIHSQIGLSTIHMTELTRLKRKQVLDHLKFTDNDIESWCLHVNRQRTISYITNHEKINPKHKQKSKIEKHFDYCLLQCIRDRFEKFIHSKNYHQLTNMYVQCDSDMSKTISNWKMQVSHKGKAYDLADAVAWCNVHDKKIKQCAEIDLRDILQNRMESDLLK